MKGGLWVEQMRQCKRYKRGSSGGWDMKKGQQQKGYEQKEDKAPGQIESQFKEGIEPECIHGVKE